MKTTIVLLALVAPASAFAVLSPYWDRAAQLTSVIQSDEVAKTLGAPIESIVNTGVFEYQVSSQHCSISVELSTRLTGKIGPAIYQLESVSPKTCQP